MADSARSLRRRGRSPETVDVYREAFDRFRAWALDAGVATVSLYWRNLRPFFTWHAKEFEVPSPYATAERAADAHRRLALGDRL